MTQSQVHWLIAFTGLVALAVLIQAAALGGIALMLIRLLGTMNKLTEHLDQKVWPLLNEVRDLVNDSVPKIKRITTNIADTSDVYRAKVGQVDALITDTANKAKKQSDHLDDMVTTTLNSVGSFVGRVEHAILTPVRQGGAVIAGIKAAAERLTQNLSRPSGAPRTPKPVAFEGESVYTGLEDDYHA